MSSYDGKIWANELLLPLLKKQYGPKRQIRMFVVNYESKMMEGELKLYNIPDLNSEEIAEKLKETFAKA